LSLKKKGVKGRECKSIPPERGKQFSEPQRERKRFLKRYLWGRGDLAWPKRTSGQKTTSTAMAFRRME